MKLAAFILGAFVFILAQENAEMHARNVALSQTAAGVELAYTSLAAQSERLRVTCNAVDAEYMQMLLSLGK